MARAGWMAAAVLLASGIAAAQPTPGRKPSCFAGRVIALEVAASPALLEFTIDPGPMGAATRFQSVAAPPEVFASWAAMVTQAYLSAAILTVQYGDAVARSPQPIGQLGMSRNAISTCTYRSPVPPIVSIEPQLR